MKFLRFMIISLTVLFVAACSSDGGQEQNSQQNNATGTQYNNVGEFVAVNQDGEDFNVTDLQGKWWVTDFIFTNCTTVCLPMTANMAKLQDKLAEENLTDVHLVSFSVDPDRDTPDVLKTYADEYGADLSRWSFVTGYEFETIKNYSIETFKNLVQEPPEGDDQVTHGTAFFLVNPDGDIVKHYSGTKSDQMDQIVTDLLSMQ